MRSFITATALSLLLSSAAFANGLSARINTSQVAVGDQFQLVLSSEGGLQRPDLEPLHKDFEVLGTSQSMQSRIVNGHRSQRTDWIVTLSPKAAGTHTIPALAAGSVSSEPLTITALEASQMPKSRGAEGISVQASIADGAHYVFQEIPLSVRIETTKPLNNAELTPPQGNFELTRNRPDKISQITRGGQVINVIERSYLLRAQNPGAIEIPPFTLRATLPDPNGRADPFGRGFGGEDPFAMMAQMRAQMGMPPSLFGDMFATGTPVSARSEAIALNVLAGAGEGWFLPAKAVELRAEWEPAVPVFREGEALTRRISLLALGARAEQLPDLAFEDASGVRIYLDDTATDMVGTPEGTAARRDYVISVVPTQGGRVTLPEVRVEWFDTVSNEAKIATLPALAVDVAGGLPVVATKPEALSPGSPPRRKAAAFGWWLFGAGALALVGAVALGKRRATTRNNGRAAVPQQPSPLSALKRAARKGDAAAFYTALLAFDTTSGKTKPVRNALQAIENARYSESPSASGVDLRAHLRAIQNARGAVSTPASNALPGLYPSGTYR